jgi:2',3'-cyclic-nucleotide 2'-phosphodiesterase (5'-nucleotidase family)
MAVTVFVQLNDLYHIDTTADALRPECMILPRVATVIKRLRKYHGEEHVKFALPGDFMGPSCLSREFKGKQMIDIMNAMKIDYVTLGNHEFDFTAEEIKNCIRQSTFKWIVTNFDFIHKESRSIYAFKKKVVPFDILRISDGIWGVIVGVMYESEFPESRSSDKLCRTQPASESISIAMDEVATSLKERGLGDDTTFCIALTHQKQHQDVALAESSNRIRLIMGGHDHDVAESTFNQRALIVKTLSNARSLRVNWIITTPTSDVPNSLELSDEQRKKVFFDLIIPLQMESVSAMFGIKLPVNVTRMTPKEIKFSELFSTSFLTNPVSTIRVGGEWLTITSMGFDTTEASFVELVPQDLSIKQKIAHWLNRSTESSVVITNAPCLLEGEDNVIRRYSTSLGNLVADMVRGHFVVSVGTREENQVGLINSGSFRIDRNIQFEEPISQKTVCDMFYHKNKLIKCRMSGASLRELLQRSLDMRNNGSHEGHGDFLQISGITVVVQRGTIREIYLLSGFGTSVLLDEKQEYAVSTTEYVTMHECFTQCFVESNPQPMTPNFDIREAVEAGLLELGKLGDLASLVVHRINVARWSGREFDRR